MKNKINFKTCIYLGVILLLSNACNKDFGAGEPLDNKGTIKEKIDTDPNFSFFKELYQYHDSVTNLTRPAVIAVGTRVPTMAGTLASEGITAYIPTNDAFIANGINTVKIGKDLNPQLFKFLSLRNNFFVPLDALRQFLGNLITTRPIEPDDFLVQSRFRTLGGTANDSLFVLNLNGEVLLGFKSKVSLASKTKLRNGNLYTVDNLILPVFNGQFIAAAAADTTLSLFSQAIVRAIGNPAPISTLTNASANTATIRATVFAPTNQAFRDAGITSASIIAMNKAALNTFVENHIIRQRIFSPQLVSGALTMVNSRPITLNVVGSTVTITSPGSLTTPATIVSPDILVVRGVIHKIDKVLRP